MCTSRPPVASRVNMLGEVVAADHVEDGVDAVGLGPAGQFGGPVLAAVVDGDFSAEPRQKLHFSSEPAVVATRAPKARAIWMAVVPMPLEPPCTRKRLPGKRRRGSNRFAQTVMTASGMAAASRIDTPVGTAMH